MRKFSESSGYGQRDSKGYWQPPQGVVISPFFRKPKSVGDITAFIFGWGGYLWPWNLVFAGIAFLTYYILLADSTFTSALSVQSILMHFMRNQIFVWILFGGLHYFFFRRKIHGTDLKYNIKFMEKSGKFLFGDQLLDNIFWTCVSGVTIWTAFEILYFYLLSRGALPLIEFGDQPVYFILLFLLLPLYRETHFYLIHRLLHWKPLLRSVHSVHHKNPNPGPWSGMSMHPLEHLLYFTPGLIFLVIPAHPVHFLFLTIANGLAPAPGHLCFDSKIFSGLFPGGDFYHFLHHRFVACNYGTASAPWDKPGGSLYDGNSDWKEWRKSKG